MVAEGVETREQLAYLEALHCEEGQGFHFSKPMNTEEFATVLGLRLKAPDSPRTKKRWGENELWVAKQEHS